MRDICLKGGFIRFKDKDNVDFNIGRISAEYEVERPLFRRKTPSEGKEKQEKNR